MMSVGEAIGIEELPFLAFRLLGLGWFVGLGFLLIKRATTNAFDP
jgi:hypothetical protein